MRVASDIGGTFTDLIYLDEVTQSALASNGRAASASQP